MAVERTTDIAGALARLSWREGRDYVMFLDSTVARFWFPNPAAREPVETALEELSGGHRLGDEDIARLRSRHSSRRNWEPIWMADAGTLILPNYFRAPSRSSECMVTFPMCRTPGGLSCRRSRPPR